MLCPACGATNRPEAKFCDDCGNRLSRVCPQCQSPVRAEAKFCDECGTRLGPAPQAAPPPPAPVAPAPPSVTLEDELRIVTVLFADVSGFTALSETLAPEEVTEVMNGCFEAIVAPISRYDGVVDKYVGDAVMARFGAPHAHEDDPERALHAALEMQLALREYNAKRWPDREPRLRLRIGVNTGEVMAGAVGAAGSQSYTVMGDTVNLASRLEHECPVGSVLIGERTYRAAQHAFEFRILPPMEIRGKAEPVQTYEVLGVKIVRPSLYGLRNNHTLLIGRDSELALVTTAIQRLIAGNGGVVIVQGEPGIGKSRLLTEASEHAPAVRWLRMSNLSYERHVPYAVFRQMLAEASEAAPQIVAAMSMAHGPALSLLTGDPLSAAEEQRQARLDPQARQRALYTAVEALLRRLASEQPLALIFDDLQWADQSGLLLLEHLIGLDLPVLLLLSFRSETGAMWTEIATRAQQRWPQRVSSISLNRLPLACIDRLLDELAPDSPLPPEICAQVVEKADGNPFFAEELIRSVVEQGLIKLVDGIWVQTTPVLSLPVSDSVQSVIASRIDSLPSTSKITLQTSAVIGRSFGLSLLQSVNQADINLRLELPVLQTRDFVYPEQPSPEEMWSFKHALTQSIAYNSLLRRRRRVLHAMIAAEIERRAGERLEQHFEQLALHHREAEQWKPAFKYYVLAARNAQRIYANASAITFFTHALDLLPNLPELPASEQAMPHEGLGDLHLLTGNLVAALGHFNSAVSLVETHATTADVRRYLASLHRKQALVHERAGDYSDGLGAVQVGLTLLTDQANTVEQAQLLITGGGLHLRSGNLEEAVSWVSHGWALAEDLDSPFDIATGSMYSGYIDINKGNAIQALPALTRAAETYTALGDLAQAAKAYNNLGIAYHDTGDWTNALVNYEHSRALRASIGDRDGTAVATANIAHLHFDKGHLETALAMFEQTLQEFVAVDSKQGANISRNNVAAVLIKLGRYHDALAHLEVAKEQFTLMQAQPNLTETERECAECWLGLGHLDAALQAAQQALSIAQECELQPEIAAAQRVLGAIWLKQANHSAAEQALQQSVTLYEADQNHFERARTQIYLAQLALARQEQTQARDLLQQAQTVFAEMGAAYEMEQVESVLAQMTFSVA